MNIISMNIFFWELLPLVLEIFQTLFYRVLSVPWDMRMRTSIGWSTYWQPSNRSMCLWTGQSRRFCGATRTQPFILPKHMILSGFTQILLAISSMLVWIVLLRMTRDTIFIYYTMIIFNHDTVKEMDSMDWYNVLGFLNSNMTQFINKRKFMYR